MSMLLRRMGDVVRVEQQRAGTVAETEHNLPPAADAIVCGVGRFGASAPSAWQR